MSELDFEQTVAIPPPPPPRRRVLPALVKWTSLLYAVCLSGLAVLLWTLADRWWPATVLLYAPRWVLTLPMILLIPLALAVHRKTLITLGIAGVVLVWPLLGLQMSLRAITQDSEKPALRVLSCNIHRLQTDGNEFRAMIDEIKPDIVALQDWSSSHQETLFGGDDWHCHRAGELFLASRYPIISGGWIQLDEPPLPGFLIRQGAAAIYRINTPSGPISIINLHLSSPHVALEAMKKVQQNSPYQLDFNSMMRDRESTSIADLAERIHEPLIILGDFNTPPESKIYRTHWSTFTNAFNAAGFGFGTTHSSTLSSVRIDHILINDALTARHCWLGQTAGSPHKPLVADLDMTGKSASVAGAGQ